jgi:hypothetical protein
VRVVRVVQLVLSAPGTYAVAPDARPRDFSAAARGVPCRLSPFDRRMVSHLRSVAGRTLRDVSRLLRPSWGNYDDLKPRTHGRRDNGGFTPRSRFGDGDWILVVTFDQARVVSIRVGLTTSPVARTAHVATGHGRPRSRGQSTTTALQNYARGWPRTGAHVRGGPSPVIHVFWARAHVGWPRPGPATVILQRAPSPYFFSSIPAVQISTSAGVMRPCGSTRASS